MGRAGHLDPGRQSCCHHCGPLLGWSGHLWTLLRGDVAFGAAVCTANGIPRLKDRHVDSCVVIVWAYFCWCDGVGLVIASFSLAFGVADFCGCLYFGGLRVRMTVAVYRGGMLAVF
ncbi:hypothetical protein NDU88_009868 [Pleurodeles waltl]|uniref:Uncharacterized protein n=1 Tax=Pleurodeles waltl TaxID=8319 RepID=A0AAV7PTA7_PLEWA|nr:hypothetical protein NDU88_009868 [Pleurodeles waltl]